jgi:hypothetical protein
LAKINYRIHTDAIQEKLVPPELTAAQTKLVYATAAVVLNMALFGMTSPSGTVDAEPIDRLIPKRVKHLDQYRMAR